MGGGAEYMGMNVDSIDPPECVRTDRRNLLKEWQEKYPEGRLVNNTRDLMSIDIANTSHIFGVFSPTHMPYHAVKTADVPSLANMTTQAIRLLKKNENGFLLMVSTHCCLEY
jgi:alkaline phosphatase